MAVFENLNRRVSTDLTFVCSDGQVGCHELIISSFAPFVKMLLKESCSDVIITPDIKRADLLEVLDVCYGARSEARNEESMKNIFCILAVNSKDILIRNVESDLQRIKYKVNTKKGWVELRYKRKKVKKVTSKSTDLELFELDSCENFPSDSQPEEMIKLEETVDHEYATKSENIVPEFSCDKCNKKMCV
jgi:hypothetical protein